MDEGGAKLTEKQRAARRGAKREKRDWEREQREREIEEAHRKDIAHRAAALVADRLGADVPALVPMIDDAGAWNFLAALKATGRANE